MVQAFDRNFLVAFGVIRSVLFNSATSDADLFWPTLMSDSLVFNVVINLSTVPIERWSSTGAIFNLMLFSFCSIS